MWICFSTHDHAIPKFFAFHFTTCHFEVNHHLSKRSSRECFGTCVSDSCTIRYPHFYTLQPPSYLTIFIRRVTIITKSDTVCLYPPFPPNSKIRGVKSWYAQLVQLKGKVLTLSFFRLMHFPLSSNQNGNDIFPTLFLIFPVKKHSAI